LADSAESLDDEVFGNACEKLAVSFLKDSGAAAKSGFVRRTIRYVSDEYSSVAPIRRHGELWEPSRLATRNSGGRVCEPQRQFW